VAEQDKRGGDDRTGEYGGDDGVPENERAEIQPGEDPGIVERPPPGEPLGTSQAERKQDKDLETGEKNPG